MNEDKSKLELISEIAEANNKNLELIQEINNLQSRIDKAIEFIEKEEVYDIYEDDIMIKKHELLDILKKED